uniref:Transaldolase n=1 Tax=Caenorhabditis tropicalis TaxID=1561998 RepID=A0A1I7TSV2_9PELO
MLSIVDFYVPDSVTFLQSQIFLDFQNKSHFGGVGPASEILHEIGKDERIAIAREAVPQWSRINDLGIDIIGKEKEELREHGIKFGNATDDVNKYLEEVKTNYALFCSAL